MSLKKVDEQILSNCRQRHSVSDMMRTAKMMSQQAREICLNGCGYRSELLYGEGYVNFKDVLAHETIELGNSDIYETMRRLYLMPLPCGTCPDNEEQCRKNNEKIISYVAKKLGTDRLYCKWLCTTKQDVIDSYDEPEGSITKWNIPVRSMVVSDCGKEGILVVSEEEVIEEL